MSRFNPDVPSPEQILRNDANVLPRAKVNRTIARNVGKKPIYPHGDGAMATTRTRSRGGRNQ